MIVLNYSATHVSIDGKVEPKIYRARAFGDSDILIEKIYSSGDYAKRVLFSDVEIDSVTYGTQEETIEALNLILYSGVGGSVSISDPDGNTISKTNPLPTSNIDGAGRTGSNTIFGDIITATRKPDIAAQFQYGIEDGTSDSELLNGGTFGITESMLYLSTGTDAAARARIESTETIRYVPGHEIYCLFTLVFDTPQPNSYQRGGIFDDDNGFFVGYEGTTFTFTRRRSGVDYNTTIDLAEFNQKNKYTLDPTKGNIYRISYGYLGFAPISIEVVTPSGALALLSRIEYPNSSLVTHTTQTFLPVRGEVGNTGNTTNLTLYSGSLSAGISNGKSDVAGRQFSYDNATEYVITNTTELVAFRNKTTFNSIKNYVIARLLLISGANDLNKNIKWKIYKNPVVLNTPTWNDVDTNNSIMEYSEDMVIDFAASSKTYLVWNEQKLSDFFENVESYKLDLPPGDTAIFVIEKTGTFSGTADLSIRWSELF
jgi:hypothetical protein